MTERPIIFNAPMVQAILDGRKTQTRRVVKLPPPFADGDSGVEVELMLLDGRVRCPYGQPGDRLWVRETWYRVGGVCWADLPHTVGPDGNVAYYAASFDRCEPRRRPSIYMPRWASRITREVTGVRVERVQDISEEDAMAEGVCETGVAYPECAVCRMPKAPRGRSAPTESANSYCAHECPGHHEPPHPGDLWPGEKRSDFGYGMVPLFAKLWDSINTKPGCSWENNPWVWVVEFKRVTP